MTQSDRKIKVLQNVLWEFMAKQKEKSKCLDKMLHESIDKH